MSQIVAATKLAADRLPALAEAATPRRRWFGGAIDRYPDVLRAEGEVVAQFEGSAIHLVTALVWLQERGIDLLASRHDDVAASLTEARGVTHIVLDSSHRRHAAELLCEQGMEVELGDYFRDFNAADDPDAGRTMAAAIKYVGGLLGELAEDQVIVISAG